MSAAVKFTKKTLPQKEGLGEKLAKKRISLGLDPKDIEKAIRVRAKHIEAIENGRYDSLPPDVYVRGFVRSYANFLKLDPNKVMKLYERERGLIEDVLRAKAGAPIVKPMTPKLIITPKTLTLGSIILGAALIFLYIGWQVIILTAPPKLTVINPKDNINIQGSSVSVEGITDTGATLYINDVEVGIDQNGEFKEKISLQSGVNIIKVRAQNKMGKFTEIKNTVVAQYASDIAAQTSTAGVEVKLIIGPRSASVQVEIDGKKTTEKPIVMLAGVTQTYKADSTIKISTNDGGSVSATVNNQDIGPISKDNESVNREFVKGMIIN